MTKIVKIVILILLLVLPSISFAADIYRWVDKDGSVTFTDDLDKVPPEYRDQVRTEEVRDSEQTQTSTPAPASGQKTEKVRDSQQTQTSTAQQTQTSTPDPASSQVTEEGIGDVRGRARYYWRERVR